MLYLIAFPHIVQNAVERHRPMAIPVDKSIEASELIAMEEQKAAVTLLFARGSTSDDDVVPHRSSIVIASLKMTTR